MYNTLYFRLYLHLNTNSGQPCVTSELDFLEDCYLGLCISVLIKVLFIGSTSENHIKSCSHILPMFSLRSSYNKEDILLFDRRIRNKLKANVVEYCCELKVDGLAVSLLYKNGCLVRGLTRGDGIYGEEVTSYIREVDSIPKYIKPDGPFPYLIELRGELYISDYGASLLNKYSKHKNRYYSTPRNAASDSLRQLEPNNTAKRSLSFYCYEGLYRPLSNSHNDNLNKLSSWGVPICEVKAICIGIKEVFSFYDTIKKIRLSLGFPIDGIAIKIDSIELQKALGFSTRHSSNWTIVYKFSSEHKKTKLNNIVYRVGKSGILTPIARFIPVSISGVTISSASLHSINYIIRLGIMANDIIVVRRAGEVTPQVVSCIPNYRSSNTKTLEFPLYCPSCHAFLKTPNNSISLYCPSGLSCPSQLKASLKHFVSKHAMNIFGLGDRIISSLVDYGLVLKSYDIYSLKEKDLLKLGFIGLKLAQKLVARINNSKRIAFSRFIYSLGILKVGRLTAIKISSVYKTLNSLLLADIDSLASIPRVGKTVASSLYFYIRTHNNSLRSLGCILEIY